jgi:O-antigen ligase
MARSPIPTGAAGDTVLQKLFACAFGLLLALSLLKLGNPVVMDAKVEMPGNAWEWMLTGWPLTVGQALLGLVILLGIPAVRQRSNIPRWLRFAPLPWLIWQFIAATDSVDGSHTTATLLHFCTAVACFYLGLFCLSPIRELRGFWSGLAAGYVLVLLSGWQQHFGGLEATRAYFFTEVYPTLNGEVPAALLKRMTSDRIFATLFYPNTLAGAILLLAPVSLGSLPLVFRQDSARRIAVLLMLALSGGCLLWSGSKAGWLLMLGLGLAALFRLHFPRTLKVGVALIVLVAGLAGFLWKYSGYLQKGAPSAVARADYWEAAVNVTRANPLTGTGPGTFGESYAAVKRPESEMAQLTHNDYLQQASDSGVPGFLLFTGFMAITMIHLGCRAWGSPNVLQFWVWLGLLGVTLQSLVDFGWYIPAICWPMMTLMGWLLGSTTNDLDKANRPNLTSGRI